MSILNYTDYKIAQSLWLQQEDDKRTNAGTNTDQFCIRKYADYLTICGVKNLEVYNKIADYLEQIDDWHLRVNDMFGPKRYNAETHENIDKLMDELTSSKTF